MESRSRAYVLDLLESYGADTQKLVMLRYELEHTVHISADEMISAMNFAHGSGSVTMNSYISDKTFYIMLNYEAKLREADRELVSDVAEQLWCLEQERGRLDLYISLLEPKQAEVIRSYYIEK